LNEKEAKEIFAAAKTKNVFIMEAMWTRFFPLMGKLKQLLHHEQKLGTLHRTFCDFALDMDLDSLPDTKYYKNPALGGGSLLDIGIYSLTWGLTTMCEATGDEAEEPEVNSSQSIAYGVDRTSTVILNFRSTGRQAICTSTLDQLQTHPWARIEGSNGRMIVDGETPSSPDTLTFQPKDGGQEEVWKFEKPGFGFWWEADAVALDLAADRKENAIVPPAETLRVLRIMDGVRRRGGARFPVDEW
jgi:predicted dehydrogenase